MSLNTLYHRVREVETPVLLVVEDSNGFVSIFCHFFFYRLRGGINPIKIKSKNAIKRNRPSAYKTFYPKIADLLNKLPLKYAFQ